MGGTDWQKPAFQRITQLKNTVYYVRSGINTKKTRKKTKKGKREVKLPLPVTEGK